jgi:selenium-binding protein 1
LKVHCLANGKIMISFLGDGEGNAPGGFMQLDEKFDIVGRWAESESSKLGYNYDFWYQPYHNIMVLTFLFCVKLTE